MNSRPFAILIALCTLCPTLSRAEDQPVRYAFQVFQLAGGFTQKATLKKPIWTGKSKDLKKVAAEVTLFDHAEFRNGKDKLTMSPKSCFWNDQRLTFEEGHEVELPEKKLKMIYSPNFVRKENELVRLKITSERPYQYMEARGDGLYALKKKEMPTGLDIEIKARKAGKNLYDISYLELDLRAVKDRKPVKGSSLPIGEPILSESEYVLKLQIQEFRSYGIVLQPKGSDSLIIIRFEVDDVPK